MRPTWSETMALQNRGTIVHLNTPLKNEYTGQQDAFGRFVRTILTMIHSKIIRAIQPISVVTKLAFLQSKLGSPQQVKNDGIKVSQERLRFSVNKVMVEAYTFRNRQTIWTINRLEDRFLLKYEARGDKSRLASEKAAPTVCWQGTKELIILFITNLVIFGQQIKFYQLNDAKFYQLKQAQTIYSIHMFKYRNNNMNYLQVQPTLVHLQGITRSSYFKIANRNDFLAVSFQIVLLEPISKALNIFPDNGILLGGEQQKIRVKLHSERAQKRELQFGVGVRFTYKTQYNKRYLSKNNMKGWEELPIEIIQKEVRVVSGGEKEAIENHIKEQIFFQKTFGTEQLNLSAIKKKQQVQKQNQSGLSLDLSSRFQNKKALWASESQSRDFNQSIEVNQIFPLVFGQSRAKQEISRIKISQVESQKNLALYESHLIKQNLSKDASIGMKTAQNNNFLMEPSSMNGSSEYESKKKTFDLIILAIISAFFVALGNNIKRVIS